MLLLSGCLPAGLPSPPAAPNRLPLTAPITRLDRPLRIAEMTSGPFSRNCLHVTQGFGAIEGVTSRPDGRSPPHSTQQCRQIHMQPLANGSARVTVTSDGKVRSFIRQTTGEISDVSLSGSAFEHLSPEQLQVTLTLEHERLQASNLSRQPVQQGSILQQGSRQCRVIGHSAIRDRAVIVADCTNASGASFIPQGTTEMQYIATAGRVAIDVQTGLDLATAMQGHVGTERGPNVQSYREYTALE